VTPWRTLRLRVVGSPRPVQAAPRPGLLRAWAEGDRSRVARVDGPDGEAVTPRDVDWTSFPGGAPDRRAGRPQTGRDVQTVVRSTAEQREAWQAAAEARGLTVAAWIRDVADTAACR